MNKRSNKKPTVTEEDNIVNRPARAKAANSERDTANSKRDTAKRQRVLSELTVAGFPKLSGLWRLTKAEEETLLGCSLNDRNPRLLPNEVLCRMGFLIGVFSYLHTLHPDEAPVDLVRQPVTELFRDLTLIDIMSTSLEGLALVHRLLKLQVEGKK